MAAIERGEVVGGRYELLEPISASSVWRVLDRRDGVVKAAQILGPGSAESVRRLSVALTAAELQHPHLLGPLSWSGDDETVVMAMPLARGGAVADLVARSGPLPDAFVAVVLAQTLDALTTLYDAGLAHPRLTPAHLLLEPTGVWRPVVRVGGLDRVVPDTGSSPVASLGLQLLAQGSPLATALARAGAEDLREVIAPFVPDEWAPTGVEVPDLDAAPTESTITFAVPDWREDTVVLQRVAAPVPASVLALGALGVALLVVALALLVP